MTRTGGLSAASAQGLKKYAKKLAEEEVSSAEEDDLLNDEDRMIGELEKKLGMDKRKSSKLGDDELDGYTQQWIVPDCRSIGWNRSFETRD